MAAESATLKRPLPDDSSPDDRDGSRLSSSQQTRRQLSGEAGSINDLIRSHPRERLFVKPLRWTRRHLTLLDCRFVKQQAPQDTTPSRPVPEEHKSLLLKAVRVQSLCYRKSWADTLLSSYGMRHLTDAGLSFSFAGKSTCRLPCSVFFPPPLTEHRGDGYYLWENRHKRIRIPTVAHLDAQSVAWSRHDSICPKTCPRLDICWRRRHLAHLCSMLPRHDPYIVAVLIALAQVVRSKLRHRTGKEHTVQIHVLYTDRDRSLVRLYSADVDPAYLAKLDQPSSFSNSSLIIRYIQCKASKGDQILEKLAEIKARGAPYEPNPSEIPLSNN